MKYKVVDVEPYKHTYRVFNKILKKYELNNVDIVEAVEYVYKKHRETNVGWGCPVVSETFRRELDIVDSRFISWLPSKYITNVTPPPKYLITDEVDGIVTLRRVQELYNIHFRKRRNYEFSDCVNERLYRDIKRKKIKRAYRYAPYNYGNGIISYRNVVCGYHRTIKTSNEIRKACADITDYGFEFVRAKRNHKNIPNSWDDINSNIYSTKKSWKHNSKRRKQWIPE